MAAHTTSDLDTYAETTIHHKVGRLIGHHGFRAQDREDLEQELTLAVIERLQGFSPALVKRNTFIAKVIDQRIADLVRHREYENRCFVSMPEPVGLDSTVADACDTVPDPRSEQQQELADLRMDLKTVLSSLTTRQQEICSLLGQYSQEEIKRRMDLPRLDFDQDMRAIREAFAKAGMHAYL